MWCERSCYSFFWSIKYWSSVQCLTDPLKCINMLKFQMHFIGRDETRNEKIRSKSKSNKFEVKTFLSSMSQTSSTANRKISSKSTGTTACPFLIADCEEEEEDSKANLQTTTTTTNNNSTKRRSGYSRQEKSLGTLTRRFMSLLRQSKTGVMDLKHVSFSEDSNRSIECRCRSPIL